MQKIKKYAPNSLSILVVLVGMVVFQYFGILNVFAQTNPVNLSLTTAGLIIRNVTNTAGQTSSMYFLTGSGDPSASSIVGQIKAEITQSSPLFGAVQIFGNNGGKLLRGFTVLPDRSLFAGGYANKDTVATDVVPTQLPPANMSSPETHRGIYDFYFSMFEGDTNSSPRLFIRSAIIHDTRDAPELALERSGQGAGKKYQPLVNVEQWNNLGMLYWRGFGGGDFNGRQAQIHARAEEVPTTTSTAGALYFATTPKGSRDPIERLKIAASGKVAINHNTSDYVREPQAWLDVNGNIKAAGCSGCADLAEDYKSKQELEAGDVVVIDPNSNGEVVRSGDPYAENILGVVSTSPAIRISEEGGINISEGDNKKSVDGYPIALSGRIPVKVSLENGSIKSGDNLTSSSVPGVAMKASKKEAVIGKALEAFNGPGIGKVKVFINVSW